MLQSWLKMLIDSLDKFLLHENCEECKYFSFLDPLTGDRLFARLPQYLIDSGVRSGQDGDGQNSTFELKNG